MRIQVFKYLSQCSTVPAEVDRFIISAFLKKNKITIRKNEFIKSFVIQENEKEVQSTLKEFISLIEKEMPKFYFEELIELFEFVISPADRIINGAIYTPPNIRTYIVSEAFKKNIAKVDNVKITDIAMGCGGFLFNAASELKKRTNKSYSEIFKNNIFGVDIQEYSVTRTKLLLSLLALEAGEDEKEYKFNLYQGDSLDFNWNNKIEKFNGFEIILGNPPYVCARNLDTNTKEKLRKWEVCKSGNSDLYIPFFQIAIENLATNGVLGFITMNSFFKSLNGRALREYFKQKKTSLKIIDFGSEQIFKSKNTYTCICFIENRQENFISYVWSQSKQLTVNHKFKKINYSEVDSKKGWNLNENKIITQIEATGIPFGELYKTRHGIATLKNDIYIFRPFAEDENFYYLQNGSVYKIEKGICKDIVNSNKLSRMIGLKELKEKVIFPYEHGKKIKIFNEIYVKEKYPEAYKYLKSKKEILDARDSGNGNYDNWFAFGRNQSLEKIKYKMFFPKYSDRTPCFIINTDEDLLFYNGLAVVGSSPKDMLLLKKIMESNVFWYYISKTSKPYSSNYYSLNGNYIKNFGICNLNDEEIEFILKENNKNILDSFFEEKYKVKI